ncbi:MAG: long-chain fatty acid--CoA ligase [Deltaproteobacteria bacterium]|nr:long-chain fatty acid--CoA ligase [Deltaproteobacteria bacterium]
MRETSLATMILQRSERYGTKPAMRTKQHGHWQDLSWQSLGKKIVRTAQGLTALGFRPGDRLAILADNHPEWAIIDLACLYLGGVDVPLYLTSPVTDLTYIMKDAGVTFLAVSGREPLAKALKIASDLPTLTHLILLDEGPKEETRLGQLPSLSLDGVMARGETSGGSSQPVPDPGLATIIYTSGTTGVPKGVMLSHTNILANTQDATAILPITEEDITLSFLPLSHGFERTAGLYTILRAGACIAYGGGTVTITKDLGEVKPTLFCCVPRVLELVYRRLLSERENASLLKHNILSWAINAAKAAGPLRVTEQALPFALGLRHRLADRLVFHKLRQVLGGRTRFLVSGGAPLSAEIARFFYGVGITVYEGYGLTEAGPVVSCNIPGHTRLGTVGRPLPQVEVKIANDGEICARGPNIMQGYYNKPTETAQMIDEHGWLHTGDIGTIDTDGYITITDRKKDLLIPSNGENVAPQPIEGQLKQDPLIEEVCLIGDKRPYVTALIVPNRALLETLAQKHATSHAWPDLLQQKEFRTLFRRRIDEINRALPLYARIHHFTLLAEPFSQDRGELTPTLKVKRREVMRTRSADIEAMYPPSTVPVDSSSASR